MKDTEVKGSLDNNTEAQHKGLSQAVESILSKSLWKDTPKELEEHVEAILEEEEANEKEAEEQTSD